MIEAKVVWGEPKRYIQPLSKSVSSATINLIDISLSHQPGALHLWGASHLDSAPAILKMNTNQEAPR